MIQNGADVEEPDFEDWLIAAVAALVVVAALVRVAWECLVG